MLMLSLIVWGIREGRQVAEEVDAFLTGSSRLPYQSGISKRSWIPPALTPDNASSDGSSDSEIASLDEETVVENVSVVAA
jgi:glutamate synthase (NADPH/NADH)